MRVSYLLRSFQRVWVFALPALGAAPVAGAAASIDLIDINTFGHYAQTYVPNVTGIEVIGESDIYHLHDGSSWSSGAGSVGYSNSQKASVAVNGNQIAYTLDTPVGGNVYRRTDYDGGNHSTNGELVSTAPLVLQTTAGSPTATLSGYARITVDQYANYTDNRFSFFSAPIGALVPFHITYTLAAGHTWSPGTLDGTFDYRLAGTLDFTNAIVPEPTTACLPLALVALWACGRRVLI